MIVDLRLAVPACLAWVAVGLAIAMPDLLAAAAVGSWVVAAMLIAGAAIWRRRRALVIAALACCATALVITSAAASAPGRRPAVMLEAAGAGRYVSATATTTQTAFTGTGSFTVTLTSIRVGDERLSVSIPARVFGVPPDRELGIGTSIRVAGTLAATQPEDELSFLVFTTAEPEVAEDPPWVLDWANGLRSAFRGTAVGLPGDGGALLPGLAIGDTSAVGTELDQAMKSSSLSHLTAVSGANCAVVIGLIMVAGGALGVPRGWRIASSVIVLAGFVVLVTPEPSVLRAAVMALFVLVSMGSGRPTRGVPVLSLAVLALLVVDPWLARSYGFVLSVLATAGLLLIAGPLTRALSRWLPVPIAAMLAIPLAAQLACQPVLILLTASIPTYGVVANMLAGPAAPAATVFGLVACVVLPVAPGIGLFFAQVAWVPAAWIAAVAAFFADLPGGSIRWLDGAAGAVLIAVVIALALFVALRSDVAARDVWRRAAAAALALVVVGYLGVAAGNSIRTILSRPGDWQYAACDIGQGDAMLVRSAGEIALIDTGPDPELVLECLDTLGVSRIDLLILTHFDLDHVGGTSAVVGRVDRALIGPPDRPEAERLVQQLRNGGADVEEVSRGFTGRLGDLRLSVLWPPAGVREFEAANDRGVVVSFDGVGGCADGCLSSIFLADLGEDSQAMLLATNRLPRVDVVKVAHHGSADQSERVYQQVDAAVGLIGVGADNDYGHPTARLLEILAAAGTTVARTDSEGIVLVAPGAEGSIELWSERGGGGVRCRCRR